MIWLALWELFLIVVLGTTGVLWSQEWRYRRSQVAWNDSRERLVINCMSQAGIVSTVPSHGAFAIDGATVRFNGDLMNFETLQEMLKVMIEQEKIRRAAAHSYLACVDSLDRWEKGNPPPMAPTWPGRPAFLN